MNATVGVRSVWYLFKRKCSQTQSPLGGAAGVGSQFGRFTQLSASKMVTPRQTIKTKALLRRLVGVGKKLGKTDMTTPSLQVDQFTIPRN